jgi:hypothetical protein
LRAMMSWLPTEKKKTAESANPEKPQVVNA